MCSVYVFISLLCLKAAFVRSQTDLEKIGSQIQDDAKNALTPSDAKNIKYDMERGIGGTTIATYDGKSPRSFIFNNNTRSICNGTLTGMQCEGTVQPFTITVKEDYCYATSYALINKDICLSSRSVTLTTTNSTLVCTSGDGTPTLVLTVQQYQELCSEVTSRHVVYRYYTNSTDPKAIPIPNPNPHVKCLNSEPGVCEFEENKAIPNTSIPSKGKDNTISNKNNTSTFIDNINGSNKLFQGIEVILFTIVAKFLIQY